MSGEHAGPGEDHESAADGRRREIIDTAAGLFDERGYHQTSIADLATASGLAKPTFYHYFASKSDVLREIHNTVDLPLGERMQERLHSDGAPSDLVRETIEDILGAMAEHRSHLRVFFEHHRELKPEDRDSVRATRRRYEHGLVEIIQRGVDSGQFRDVDPNLTALAIFGLCNWSYQWLPRQLSATKAEQIALQLLDLVFEGLLAPSAGASRPKRSRRSAGNR